MNQPHDVAGDVPSPIDLQSPKDAAEWERTATAVRPWRVEFFACFAAEINKASGPQRVLELGSGPGFLATHLLAASTNVSMTLLDFSAAMHDLARVRLAPYIQRVEFIERSFKNAGWFAGLGNFDFVITNQAVHELRHKRYATTLHAQVRRVLKPQGTYLVCDHHAGDGGMQNTDLYMTVAEQREALQLAGYQSINMLKQHNGMVLFSAA